MTQLDGIKNALVGSFYSRFSVHSGFELHFDESVLSAHNLTSDDEAIVNVKFVGGYAPSRQTANPELIAKSAILAACLGASVASVDLSPDSSLHLTFSNGVTISLPTDTPVVDWQWAFTEDGRDPYLGCFMACFAPGDIRGSMPNKSFKPNPLRGSA